MGKLKPTDIPPSVKRVVWERDNHHCIVCGRPVPLYFACAHVFVRRSHGGKGVEQNIATLCAECHRAYDQGKDAESNYVKSILFEYMKKQYKNINIKELKV